MSVNGENADLSQEELEKLLEELPEIIAELEKTVADKPAIPPEE